MKNLKTNLITSSLMALALMTTSAHADLIIEQDTSEPIKQATTKATKKVVHVGTPAATTKFKGFGDNVSLRTALEQVVPADWQVVQAQSSKPINVMASVTYNEKGDKGWEQVVPTIVDNSTKVTYDWDKKTVYLNAGDIKSALVTYENSEVKPKKATGKKAAKKHVAKKAKSNKTAKTTQTNGSWNLQSGITLKDNLIAWGQKAGYKVIWDQGAPNYMINAPVSIKGQFIGEDGALSQIIHSYKDEPRPLRVTVKEGNKVVYVQPWVKYPELQDIRPDVTDVIKANY